MHFKRECLTLELRCFIHDYTACSTMPGRTTKGYVACLHCDKEHLSFSIKNKLCYIGHHRFLDERHKFWKITDLKGKPFGAKYNSKQKALAKFTAAEIQVELEKVRHLKPGIGSESVPAKRKRGEPSPIWNRRHGLWDLPYRTSLKLAHNIDMMHVEKNILENILGTFLELDWSWQI